MKRKHVWVMLLCCLIPVVAIVAVRVFNVPLGTLGIFALLLLCPLSHILMMRGSGHEGHHFESENAPAVSKDTKE